jgi:hypothetical protein
MKVIIAGVWDKFHPILKSDVKKTKRGVVIRNHNLLSPKGPGINGIYLWASFSRSPLRNIVVSMLTLSQAPEKTKILTILKMRWSREKK